MQLLQQSTEYLHIPITGPDAASLGAGQIEVAILDGDALPTDADWTPVDGYDPAIGQARVLVGPGSPRGILPTGSPAVYVRVTDAPERPVLYAGRI